MDPDLAYPTIEDQMQLARALPGEPPRGSGEPFGAVILPGDEEAARPGVNLVLYSGYSFAHAEMVALVIAQQILGDFDLGGGRGSPLTSWSPAPSLAPCASVRIPGPV